MIRRAVRKKIAEHDKDWHIRDKREYLRVVKKVSM